jgi:hypothetical protein
MCKFGTGDCKPGTSSRSEANIVQYLLGLAETFLVNQMLEQTFFSYCEGMSLVTRQIPSSFGVTSALVTASTGVSSRPVLV